MKNERNSLSECTTIIVGEKQMKDGSRIVGRSSDFDAMIATNMHVHEDTKFGPKEFIAKDSAFRCPLPEDALGYIEVPDYRFPGEWGSAGFNTLGVGMSSTETIFSSEKALNFDPYVENGLAEICTFNIVLPYIHSAREGVQRLASLIEEYGSAEGFGIAFMDNKETWYLENCCGHRYLACKMPKEEYFVTGNQSRFRHYDPEDKENFIASADLIDFAQHNGLYDPKQGDFDFHQAYQRDEQLDHTYNYPRVWGLQQMFSPQIKNDVNKNTFPVFAKADRLLSVEDIKQAFRFHYDNTEHDPYLHSNPKERYRPVSIFRTTQTHILQVRDWLPTEIGCLEYLALGMADLGVFLPIYEGVRSYPKAYMIGEDRANRESAYWKFRVVMTLAMTDYNLFAPLVKEKYSAFEIQTQQKQKEMEEDYLKIYQTHPMKAKKLLQDFSDEVLNEALLLADNLTDELLTRMTYNTNKTYNFHGA